MKKYGVIGVGSMGAMLVRKFTETGAIRPGDIVASNRTRGKAASLAEKIGFKEVESNVETARQSDIVFLCVKPLDVKRTLLELNKVLTPDKLLVSIAAGVTMENLLLLSRARVAKVIPSLTSECLRGVSLVAFAQNANESDRGEVFRLFRAISSPVEIDEGNFELFADLTSCAPAFIASIMREFVQAAAKKGDVPERFVEYLVRETLAGTA
jgi:competence protein ComER